MQIQKKIKKKIFFFGGGGFWGGMGGPVRGVRMDGWGREGGGVGFGGSGWM